MRDNGWAPTTAGRKKKGAWTRKKIRQQREAREQALGIYKEPKRRELGVVRSSPPM